MNESGHDDASQQPAYRIGATARLTGLSTHTLRKWEDRYALVDPRRSPGGERLYSATDVKRLALIKDLARAGMTLSELAPLAVEELERLSRQGRERDAPVRAAPARARVSVAVVGTALPLLLERDASRFRRVRVIAHGERAAAAAAMLGEDSPDVALLECPAVSAATGGQVAQAMHTLHAGAAIVVYGFGARADLDALRRPDVALLHAPVDALELERLCLALVVSPGQRWEAPAPVRPPADDAPIAPRRFSSEQLARMAGIASTIACECPRHLADLILGLDAFEQYSANCENRDDKDAALHRYLRITAACGRALFEDALARVAEHEGIELRATPAP
jgi:DNA-binding transcriptional MerR regulator